MCPHRFARSARSLRRPVRARQGQAVYLPASLRSFPLRLSGGSGMGPLRAATARSLQDAPVRLRQQRPGLFRVSRVSRRSERSAAGSGLFGNGTNATRLFLWSRVSTRSERSAAGSGLFGNGTNATRLSSCRVSRHGASEARPVRAFGNATNATRLSSCRVSRNGASEAMRTVRASHEVITPEELRVRCARSSSAPGRGARSGFCVHGGAG